MQLCHTSDTGQTHQNKTSRQCALFGPNGLAITGKTWGAPDMTFRRFLTYAGLLILIGLVAACGQRTGPPPEIVGPPVREGSPNQTGVFSNEGEGSSLFDAFRRDRNETNVLVNRYIWSASLEVLNFLPVQEVDPFSGVIVTGFGTPPNGGRAYRATILVRDPALEARSLNVSLQTRSGPASAAAVRAVEDAILTRARQLRVADSRF